MTRDEIIKRLGRKRGRIVQRWGRVERPIFRNDTDAGRWTYILATDRMQRLTHAIDRALVRLGVEV